MIVINGEDIFFFSVHSAAECRRGAAAGIY